jgi:hypothetical protein
MASTLFDFEAIERIDTGISESVLLGYFILSDCKTSKLSCYDYEEVVDAEEGFEFYSLEGFDDMADEVAGTIGQDQWFVIDDQLLLQVSIADEPEH